MPEPRPRISIDWWSVLIALTAVTLVRLNLLPHIPW